MNRTIWQIPKLSQQPIRSRLAPTPSGYLHLGNALNFLIAWILVRSHGGVLHLRIDDMDAYRCHREYVEDIFYTLEWLGIDWDSGPDGMESFERDFSFQHERERYREELGQLYEQYPAVYACACSRQQVVGRGGGNVYDGYCRKRGLEFQPEVHAVRLRIPDEKMLGFGKEMHLGHEMGDVVLWRKENIPSYQFASLLADEKMGTSLIIRGEDLLPSSLVQRYMSRLFGVESFAACEIVHHSLIMATDGQKLSKSLQSAALKNIRESGEKPTMIYQKVAEFLGYEASSIHTLNDLKELVSG